MNGRRPKDCTMLAERLRESFVSTEEIMDAQWSVWDALEGDYRMLAARLRDGFVSTEEKAFLADLLQGKIKPRRRRKGQPKRIVNLLLLAMGVLRMEATIPSVRRKEAVGLVAKVNGVSDKHVGNALAEFGDVARALLQRERNLSAEEIADMLPLDDAE
jgi:hypothetical protein